MEKRKIYNTDGVDLTDEYFQKIGGDEDITIERIISKGHVTPSDKWYDQELNEFVLLLRGSARILFEGEEEIKLNVGDYLTIPSNKRHRVTWTDPAIETFWLAVHYK